MEKVLLGKKAIITGASHGLGFEIACKFIRAGAELMVCARDLSSLEDACARLKHLAVRGQKVVAYPCDVSLPNNISQLVEYTLTELGGCQILVNNAGVYGPKGTLESVDWEEWLKAIEINLFGSVLMSRALLSHFRTQGYGKIIQLSGGGATSPMPRLSAYAASKAAVVRFAETLAEELRGTGIDVNCIAPGPLNTRMLDEVLQAGPENVGSAFYEQSVKQKISGGSPLLKGAELALFLASSRSDGITGKLISAIWDNWEAWPEHLHELSRNDAYTLRRITGKERGLEWGDK
jgi:3-oxoacyl-[acyl-carrier protein] reductase